MALEEGLQKALVHLKAHSRETFLALDFDGTLAPIVDDPARVALPPGTPETLEALARNYHTLAFISGREVVDLKKRVGIEAAWYVGNHGFEQLSLHGEVEHDKRLNGYRGPLAGLLEQFLPHFEEVGITVEDKGVTASLHRRRAPDRTRAQAVLDEVAHAAPAHGLVSRPAREVLELRPALEINKGTATKALLERCAPRLAFYIGDDTTDLDAMAALKAWEAQDPSRFTLCVGVASAEGPVGLADHSDFVLGNQEQVSFVLKALL